MPPELVLSLLVKPVLAAVLRGGSRGSPAPRPPALALAAHAVLLSWRSWLASAADAARAALSAQTGGTLIAPRAAALVFLRGASLGADATAWGAWLTLLEHTLLPPALAAAAVAHAVVAGGQRQRAGEQRDTTLTRPVALLQNPYVWRVLNMPTLPGDVALATGELHPPLPPHSSTPCVLVDVAAAVRAALACTRTRARLLQLLQAAPEVLWDVINGIRYSQDGGHLPDATVGVLTRLALLAATLLGTLAAGGLPLELCQGVAFSTQYALSLAAGAAPHVAQERVERHRGASHSDLAAWATRIVKQLIEIVIGSPPVLVTAGTPR